MGFFLLRGFFDAIQARAQMIFLSFILMEGEGGGLWVVCFVFIILEKQTLRLFSPSVHMQS